MDKIYDNCCGIDVHKKVIVACFRRGKEKELKTIGATTRELLELSDWLLAGGCEMVAMESTGSYWKPLYNVLEYSGLNAIVVNAQHMKKCPWPKNGCSRCRMDCRAFTAWFTESQLYPE